MRYFIQLSYFGKNYHGWQVQPNAISVQEELNKALSTILRTDIHVVGAGRTDTGVHARVMWAHFDSEVEFDDHFLYRLNGFLPPDIAVQQIIPVDAQAHARFDALQRGYEYHISTRKDPFNRDQAWLITQPLDLNSMQEAAQLLFEFEDFSAFSKSHTQTKTNNCRIDEAYWERSSNGLVFYIRADRFLRNMVRAIVGTLVQVGRAKISVDEVREIIASKDRRRAGESAPAEGLYLTEVKYPKEIFEWQKRKV